MPQVNPLAVDRSKEGSAVQILPCPPLLASHKFGWNGFHFQHHKQLAWESIEHFVTHHTIVVHHFEHPIYTQQMVDGRKQRRQIINGHIAIAPANVEQKAFWDKEIGFTLLFLEPAYITRIADESVDMEGFELVAHFAKPDPLIDQIGLALKAELEAGELDTQLYAESVATMLSAHLLRHYSAQKHRLPKDRGRLSQRRLQPVIDYINREHVTFAR